jgi:hypothetical protein
MSKATFKQVYVQYLSEMGLTFPELEKAADKALKSTSYSDFYKVVSPILSQIASRDASIFTDTGVSIAPGVVMTKKLWKEGGKSTQSAIWEFLSSLTLLATFEMKHSKKGEKAEKAEKAEKTEESGDFLNGFDISGANIDLKKMFESLGSSFSNQSFGNFFEGIKEAAENMKDTFSGISGESLPKMPERLFKGHIAKIAEELAKDFKPEDFGLSPELLQSNDPTAVFDYLQEIFTKKPEMLMTGAKKIASRIQDKLRRGEVRREDLVKEAEELMGEFKNNPMFSQIFEQLGAQLRNAGGGGGGDTGSARRKEVQERLRKKLAEKEKAKREAANKQ